MRVFGCRKFRRLSNQQLDQDLSLRDEAFLQKHRMACYPCERSEVQSSLALNMLRSATLEAEADSSFDDRLLRKLRVRTTRESLRYWSPAVAGAFIAGLAIVAALQMITQPEQLPHVRLPGHEARSIKTAAPVLDQALNSSFLK